jgi:hypothetical protein
MDTLETVLTVIILVVLVALMALAARGAAPVTVNDETLIPVAPAELEGRAVRGLRSIPRATVTQPFPSQFLVCSKRIPPWAIVVGLLTLPFGLILLLLVRSRMVLLVRLDDDGGSTRVRAAGQARTDVALAVGHTVTRLRPAAVA